MHDFRVWAPAAASVDLLLDDGGRRLAMQRAEAERAEAEHAAERAAEAPAGPGWWRLAVPEAGHGTRYAYSVDGGPASPDPRSAWQPDGVHASSAVFDPHRHAWADSRWAGRSALGAVFYELHVGTFTPTGKLDAAVAHLDHLVALGVDVVELLPVAAFDGRWGWGYDGVSIYAVHDSYGGPAALQRFVDACHGRGLAVALDVVYNHLGPSGNYLARFGPYFTDRHHTPWGAAVNLDDTGSEQVRRWVVDAALRWFADFHVDVLRLDAVHELVDDSPRHLLAELSDETAALADRLGRPLSLVAESDLNDAVMVTPTADGGFGMTAQWDDDVHHALHALLTGERQGYYADFGSVGVLGTTLTEAFWHAERWSSFRGAMWGRRLDTGSVGGHRFLTYLQNHDQIGNRAVGDRTAATLTDGQLRIGAALVLTSAFTPMLFMGEEWAASTPWQFFTDFPDPELGAAVSHGRRSEFADHGWAAEQVPDPQDPATRDRSVLRWDEVGSERHARMLRWHTDLVALRRSEPDLQDDRLDQVRVDAGGGDPGWLVVRRGAVRVAVNLGGSPAQVPLDARVEQVLLSAAGAADAAADARPRLAVPGDTSVRLAGHDVVVVRVAPVTASS